DECLALADLGASIYLMPLSVWEGISLPELTLTCMTLELTDRSVSKPVGIAKDVSVKVGVFHFPADFVVVDFKPDPRVPLILRRCFLKTGRALIDVHKDFVVVDFEPDPRVPLILGRCFLKTGRALIDVHKGKLTLRIKNEAITYNLDQTSRYSANYNQMMTNKIDVIDMACEEYSQEVLSFSDVTASGNPTLYDDPIVSTTSPTLTPFGDSDFLLFEEADAFLGLEDDPNSPKFNLFYNDPEGDILLLEAILNSEPLPSSPIMNNICLRSRKNSRFGKLKLLNLPLMNLMRLNLRTYLPPSNTHFWRATTSCPSLLSKKVEKLLDAGLIYPISDSPWVSLVHCVPKKSGFTIVENEENELIPTRLFIGWRVCIDYQKLNEATRKDHFPFPFMDQILERLAGNEYYCFLDGFSGYFQIPVDPRDQEKTTFTCPYETFVYRRMPFGLCNAQGTFQRCMLAIFHDMVEKTMEVFMDDFSIFGNSFENCLSRLDKMLQSMVSFRGDFNAPWFADFANYHAGNFIVKAKALPTNDARVVCKFLKSLFARFGAPRAIISDHGENLASWSVKLDDALSAFRIAYKTPIGCTPYKLVYGKACHLPIELEHKAYWALKQANFDLAVAGDHRKRIHNSKIKNRVFNVGDRVLLFNSRLKIFSGKLKTRWSGPFTIAKVFPYGTVELSQANGPNFKVNGHRVKHYFGGDVPQLVVPDLQTFPMDQ
nr:reverse transcriptase domain-containing protein [Tanacetum cinerariifolium]